MSFIHLQHGFDPYPSKISKYVLIIRDTTTPNHRFICEFCRPFGLLPGSTHQTGLCLMIQSAEVLRKYLEPPAMLEHP